MIRDPERLPFVGPILEAGADDPVFDLYLLTGPAVIAGVAIAGRHPWSVGIVGSYVGLFAGYLGYKGMQRAND